MGFWYKKLAVATNIKPLTGFLANCLNENIYLAPQKKN